jgi:hypothetical protein
VTATPAELTLRNTIPTAIVLIQTATPVGTTAKGRRHPRHISQPTAAPTRNGQAVCATPEIVRPSAWLRLPIAQNASTHTVSAATADHTCRLSTS